VARSLAIVAGLLVAISPLMLRNLIVGAPVFSATTRAPLAFVMGNAPGTMPVGASIPPETREILNASEYRLLPTIAGTLRAYHGQVGRYLLLQWRKLSGLFGSYEVPDNPSFYYAALDSPVLRYGMRFSCIVGLGLVGMILGARRLRGHLLLYLYTVAILSLFLAAQVVSRYRQPLLIPLFVFAGLAITRAWELLRSRRAGVAAAVLAGSVAVSFAMPLNPPHGYRYYRPAEFLAAAGYLEEKGEAKAAGKEIHRAVSYSLEEDGPSEERIDVEFDLTQLYLRHRMFPQALSVLHDILDERPGDAEALATKGAIHQDINQPWQALQYLMAAAKADPNNAEVHARLGHLYWFVFESPDNAVTQLEKALQLEPSSPVAPRIRALIDQIKSSPGKPS
ncbi:MAG TPA: hypothetical protein VNI57_03680, partial [Candidatus Saccharimonadales bacterium]|nr:hypothetical protein [Candidatus Saccharimonadales bacterium]